MSGFELLSQSNEKVALPDSFQPSPDYDHYLRMHKVLVGEKGATELEGIYENLRCEDMPQYLSTAGWAAVEAALVKRSDPSVRRLELIDGAINCWKRALVNQKAFNEAESGLMVEYADPYRLALDLAAVPLFKDIVTGGVRQETTKKVFEDSLNIAQANAVKIDLMKKEGNIEGLSQHTGLGYEMNALLAFNRRQSPTWFVVPSMIRADTGYHYRDQTHDLLVIHQKRGQLLSIAPVEVKSRASNKDRERYKALLVRGKMHLSVEGRHRPSDTLNAITACYEGAADDSDHRLANEITDRFTRMVRDYYAGPRLGSVATARSPVGFHDNSRVVMNHPGLKAA